MSERAPLLLWQDVWRTYERHRATPWSPRHAVDAVRGVNLEVLPGRHLGVVGESGSGKSTLARLALALEPPTRGQVLWQGLNPHALTARALRQQRRHVQMVFQDPYGSLDPRHRIGRIVAEPLHLVGVDAEDARVHAGAMLEAVGLRVSDLDKYPHQFSGGQRQRVAIARALVTQPRLIVADEPVSALDVSVQAQVLNLMQDLAAQFGITYLLISHDLAVVWHLCDDIAVMRAGQIVERGSPEQLLHQPQHPYTRSLLEAAGAAI